MTTAKANGAGARASTGVSGLDDILSGGLPVNHLYLLEGDPGTGKTTVALQFLLEGVALGERVLYVTLSESKAELEGVAASHNWSLDGLRIFEMTPSEDELDPAAQYTVFHPAEVELADTIASVLAQVNELAPTRVVFDSLSELRMLARDSLRYRRQILALKRYFGGRNCTVLLIDDRTAEGNDLQLQSIAHGVIIMQSLERDYGVKRRRLEIRKLRGSRFREGYHDYTIHTGGVSVFPRLIAAEHRAAAQAHSVSSGMDGLDELLGGGLDSGTSTLLLGPAGCGKSTVAAKYLFSAAQRGETSAIFTFDESPANLLKRSAALGMDFAPHLRSGLVTLQQIDPAEISPGEFTNRLRSIVEKKRVKLIVIDSLNGYMNAMPDEQFLTLQLHELHSYLGQQGVTTIQTMAQHGVMGRDMRAPLDVSYLADTVVLFRYFESSGEVKQAISAMKRRTGSHERSIRELIFRDNSLRVGPALTQFEGVLTGTPKLIRNDFD